MRKQFIETTSRKDAVAAMPWAAKIVKVDGGYMGFESADDYTVWRNQK